MYSFALAFRAFDLCVDHVAWIVPLGFTRVACPLFGTLAHVACLPSGPPIARSPLLFGPCPSFAGDTRLIGRSASAVRPCSPCVRSCVDHVAWRFVPFGLARVALPAVRYSCPCRAPAVRVRPSHIPLYLFGPPHRSLGSLFVRALRLCRPPMSFVQHPARVGTRRCHPPPDSPCRTLICSGALPLLSAHAARCLLRYTG